MPKVLPEFAREVLVPEYEEKRSDGKVSTIVPNLSVYEIAERLNISVEAADALVNASLRG
jgi:hypothetical protein